ncbi:MAG: VWA domain-containing protein [Candidatus Sulfotelmatobacter sp.]
MRLSAPPKFCLFFVLVAGVFAQQAPDPGKQAPSPATQGSVAPIAEFKSRTDLVLVPVVVRDKKGNHVSGLSKDAFRLEENGKEQSISLFEEVQAPGSIVPAATDRGYSNLPFDNASQIRLTIIVLDLLNTGILARTDGRDWILKFLSKGLVPNQPVSLLCLTSQGLKLVFPFSTDANALIQGLKSISLGAETIMDRRNVVIHTIEQLKEIAQAYRGLPGRKTMIFAAGYIPEITPEREIIPTSGYTEDLREMWQALIDANIALYPVQLMSWSRDPSMHGLASRPNGMLLRDVAEFTGGNLCVEENGLLNCLAEAIEDSRSYYMLGFSVAMNDRKPGWRDLKVKVAEAHVDVRARNGFYYGVAPVKDAKSARSEEVNALASSLAYSAVPMFVKVLGRAPASDPAQSSQKISVLFLITIPLSGVKIDSSRPDALDLDVGAIALTRDVREAAEFLHPVGGNPKAEQLQAWGREGIKLHEKLELPPGSYDIRFLARDNNASQIGTVVFPLDVQ